MTTTETDRSTEMIKKAIQYQKESNELVLLIGSSPEQAKEFSARWISLDDREELWILGPSVFYGARIIARCRPIQELPASFIFSTRPEVFVDPSVHDQQLESGESLL